jgi:hypothetical protein
MTGPAELSLGVQQPSQREGEGDGRRRRCDSYYVVRSHAQADDVYPDVHE